MKTSVSDVYMPRIQHHFNFIPDDHVDYSDWPVSLTVPDQVMTMEEIIKRFTRGQAVPDASSNMQYADVDMSKYDNMNQFERIDFKRQLSRNINLSKKKLKEAADVADAKKKKEFFDSEVLRVANEIKAKEGQSLV